jgi:hypothetical protein
MDHTGGSTANSIFCKFEFIFEKALGYESVGWGTCFDEKNQRQNLLCQCPFKVLFAMRWERYLVHWYDLKELF